jgi:hypothetical protein
LHDDVDGRGPAEPLDPQRRGRRPSGREGAQVTIEPRGHRRCLNGARTGRASGTATGRGAAEHAGGESQYDEGACKGQRCRRAA